MPGKLIQRGKVYYLRYTGADGRRTMKRLSTDKRVAEQLARKIEDEQDRIRGGWIDEKDIAYRDHGTRPLAEHIDAWRANLLHEEATCKHVDQAANRVRRLVAVAFGARPDDIDGKTTTRRQHAEARETVGRLVGKARLSDLDAERVQAALATPRSSGRSAETCNHYRAAVRAFARWAKRTGRLRESSLEGLAEFNAKEDRRHDRRTLSLDELHRLIRAAERGPVVLGLPGPARALCYRLAVSTGLRYSEIASIRPESFDWRAGSVTVPAAYTKNGDPATLPIPRDLADDLAAHVTAVPAGSPVFRLVKNKGTELLRRDLAAADIAYQDASGLFFDFHSLRCETATLADAAGVSPRVVQKMMRHSTLELTGRYTKPRAVDIEAAAEKLPSLKPAGDQPETQAATGTDASHADAFAPILIRSGDVSGRAESLPDVITLSNAPGSMEGESPENKARGASLRVGASPVASDPRRSGSAPDRYMRPLLERIQKGEIDPTFVITHKLPLDEAPAAYKMFRDKQDECLKVVLYP
jgi:integrase